MNKKNFRWIATFVFATLTFCLSACKNNNAAKGPKKMAVIVSTLNNPWFVFLVEKAAAKAKELGYETKIFDSQNNTALETDRFENTIASAT